MEEGEGEKECERGSVREGVCAREEGERERRGK